MTDLSHYDEAKNALSRAASGILEDPLDLATGQLHALLAMADELSIVREELAEIHRLLASSSP